MRIPRILPVGAAHYKRMGQAVEIVLHVGCHRTGTTTFQSFIRENVEVLSQRDIAFWGPRRTRNGLFAGLIPGEGQMVPANVRKRAVGRVRVNLDQMAEAGKPTLLVSDENMIGSVRSNIRNAALYPAIGERMARYAEAFDNRITRIAIGIRSQDRYWASALAYGIARGHPVPSDQKLKEIANSTRSWRDVITDLSCAVPDAEICVIPYESYYANPVTLLDKACKVETGLRGNFGWLNRSPDLPTLRDMLRERGEGAEKLPDGEGPWQPFVEAQIAQMQEKFADDLFWLAAGAGGMASMTEEALPGGRGKAHRLGPTRGHENGGQGHLDQTG